MILLAEEIKQELGEIPAQAPEEGSPAAAFATTTTSPLPAVEVGQGQYEVIMTKGATGVGFCLEGGVGSPKGDLPITIKRIFKGRCLVCITLCLLLTFYIWF
jgi:hypothetical protein